MNPKITSNEEIMATCRQIVSKEGIQALNMRHVAEVLGIASGSLYHYFPSKEEMITAVVESVWLDIFHLKEKNKCIDSFREYVRWLYQCVHEGRKNYPNFSIAHSMSFAASAKPEAKATMMQCFALIKHDMIQVLERDTAVNARAFTKSFTKTDFIDYIFSSFYVSLLQSNDNSGMLLQVIDRCIYQN